MQAAEIKKVTCIGAGVIGYSWALYFALKDLSVTVYDVKQEALTLTEQRIGESLAALVKNGVVKDAETADIMGRINYTTAMEQAAGEAQFIIESGPENYDIKRQIVREAEEFCGAETIFASSTSGLLISEIARDAKHPERFIGAHPYNPPHLIPLVEISRGEKTTDEVIQTAKQFFTLIGKEPVVLQKEALGFICNRIQMALYREVCDLVMRGVCTVEDADKAVTFGPGLRWGIMGPSLVFHLGGGQGGIDGIMQHLKPSIDLWLKDMADFKEFPAEFGATARAGVEEELQNRPAAIGNDAASLAEYRDKMLIEMLKLHGKL